MGVSVREGWRRQGIARRLLEGAVAGTRAGSLGRLTLEVDPANRAARDLYRSLGFVETGQEEGRLAMALELG